MKKISKLERQKLLQEKLKENPFFIDKELAEIFDVSIQTIRLDRMELGIPEVRKRIKTVAKRANDQLKSVQSEEVIGELVDINLDKAGISIMETSKELLLEKSKVVRGHHIFAQANSLAVAIIDTDVALTGSAKIRYNRPVYLGERLIAKAKVENKKGNKFCVRVETKVKGELVFSGEFIVFSVEADNGIEEV
ncbi:transcription factor FapR [Halonatronum saccharophilum]|uniref:transcription factor FapR n=1 Tax=Halonatronum saccharophilum TaxID=150060 RepID=UPI000487B718|nr:transcription factor FapR [Halonatronum saccharophilum]